MRKILMLFVCATASLACFADSEKVAQFSTYSPYSIFGIGQRRFQGSAETLAMGGAGGVYASPVVLNMQNPATLSSLGYTAYTLGANFETVSYKDALSKDNNSNVYLNYLMLGFPLLKKKDESKLGFALGLAPYSVVGYSATDSTSIDMGDGQGDRYQLNQYDGSGGLNKVFIGLGYKLFKNVSLGVEASYLFGNIRRNTYSQVESIIGATSLREKNQIYGFEFKFGGVYNFKISRYYYGFIGATYSFSSNLRNSRVFQVNMVNTTADSEDLITEGETVLRFKLPQTVSAALGFGNVYKWFIGGQWEYGQKADYGNVDFGATIGQYKPQHKFSLGASWTPQYNSVNSYFHRINYRIGGYYNQTGLVVNQTDINDVGITVGAGFPFTKRDSQTLVGSAINVFFNFGRYGTTAANLVRESYFRLGVSFSLNDLWFRKPTYY